MKLYYSPGTCSLADHIVLEWTGAPYELVRVEREERKQPAFLEINPAGAVPVFEDGGKRLLQNSAILNYLADKFPATKLGGDGSAWSRAEVNQWLALINSDLHPLFKPFFGGSDYLEDKAVIEKTQENARKSLRTLFERLDRQLEGRDWLTGARSIADPYLFVVLRWAKAQHIDLGGLANLARFEKHIRADAGVKKALKEQAID